MKTLELLTDHVNSKINRTTKIANDNKHKGNDYCAGKRHYDKGRILSMQNALDTSDIDDIHDVVVKAQHPVYCKGFTRLGNGNIIKR